MEKLYWELIKCIINNLVDVLRSQSVQLTVLDDSYS